MIDIYLNMLIELFKIQIFQSIKSKYKLNEEDSFKLMYCKK